MAPLDAMTALPDIDAALPAGPDLEFDADFIELEQLAQGKAEQQYGATVVPAEPPDWKGALAKATALLARTYDLRVLAHLAVARLHVQGIAGYAATVAMIREVLDTRWAAVHPQLDPEDGNDPTLRANALLRIAEPGKVLRALRDMPLARSPRSGAVCWRDIAVSAGSMEAEEGREKLGEAVIQGAFRDTDAAALAALRAGLAAAAADVAAIPAAFDREAGHGSGPDFQELGKLLREVARAVDKYTPAEEAAPEVEAEEPSAPRAAAPRTAPAAVTSVATRAEAMRLLDLVVRYYEENEPSSPLPLLIGRARRLADKGFLDLLRDLAPDGVSQAETIAGRPAE